MEKIYQKIGRTGLQIPFPLIQQYGLKDCISEIAILEIEKYLVHALRQIDQIERRVINDETIPHNEKVFSIFEEHTEWISKGKAGLSC